MLMMKHTACKDCRQLFLDLVRELSDNPSSVILLQELLTHVDPRDAEEWPTDRELVKKNNFGLVLDHFNSNRVTKVDAYVPKPTGQSTMRIGVFESFDSSHESYHDRSALSKVLCNPNI